MQKGEKMIKFLIELLSELRMIISILLLIKELTLKNDEDKISPQILNAIDMATERMTQITNKIEMILASRERS